MIPSVRELLEARVGTRSGEVFLFSAADGRDWTYREFDAAVNRTANMLRSNGIGKGDVVSLLLPNSAEYVIAYFACWKIGAVAGPVSSLLKPDEIEWVVGNSESRLMLIGRSEPPAVAGGLSESPRDSKRVSEPRIQPPATTGGSDSCRQIVFDNVSIADNFPDTLDHVDIDTDDEAIIIYTSGTTGKPKGCLLTHGNLIANARQIAEWMNFTESDRLLTVMPLFHMNGVSVTTLTALYAGGSTVVAPKFSSSKFWETVEKYRITSFGSVATMLSMLLSGPRPQVPGPKSDNPKSKIQNPKSKIRNASFRNVRFRTRPSGGPEEIRRDIRRARDRGLRFERIDLSVDVQSP